MKRIFFQTNFTKTGKKFDYFIEFNDMDIERVKKEEITVDSITDFIFGILCSEKQKSKVINFVLKEKMEFGNFKVFINECYNVDISSLFFRQI